MKKIFKYSIPISKTKFSILLPYEYKVLRVGFQAEQLFMWAEFSDGAQNVQYDFQVFGTGQDIKPGAEYVATYELGPLVMHLYRM